MAKQKKKSQINESKDFVWEEFQKWLAYAKVSHKRWDELLEELRQLNSQLLEEKQQDERIEYFERSIEQLIQTCFSTLSKEDQIKLQLRKGHTYESLGAWDKALSTYQRVIDLSKSAEFTSYRSEAYRWIGLIYLMQNRWREALNSFEESLNLALSIEDEANVAYAYNSLGYYHFEQGELTEAKSYWEKALELAEKINDSKFIAQVYNNLGALANMQGNWEKALAYYSESVPRFEKVGESRGLAETYHNLGMTGRWSEAGVNYEKSYRLAKEIGDVRLQAMVKLNRVELYLSIGDLHLAEALCHQALRIFTKLQDHLGEADVNKLLGVVRSRMQDWSSAKDYFEKSVQISKKFRSPLCEAEALFEYGSMLVAKGNKRSAQKQLEQALILFSQLNMTKEVEKVNQVLQTLK